jgi:hypothetical protein
MEIQGLTPVDTIYEFVGHMVGLRLSTYLIWQGYFVIFVLGAAFLRLYYLGSREGSYTELGVYPIYVLFVFFLLWPIPVALSAPRTMDPTQGANEPAGGMQSAESVNVPRILAYVTALTDALQQYLIRDLKSMVGNTMHEWSRIAALNEKTRFLGWDVRTDVRRYVQYCYWPAMTQDGHPLGDPWALVPLADLPIDDWLLARYQEINLQAPTSSTVYTRGPIACQDLHSNLKASIAGELRTDKFHQGALAAYSAVNVDPAQSLKFYRRRILYNEIFVIGGLEGASIRQALPAYTLTAGADSSGLNSQYMDMSVTNDSSIGGTIKNLFANLPVAAATVASTLSEWWSQKAMGPATYYRVSSLGPHIYGMLISLLFMLFPIAGLMAFWPKWWTAIVNFMKVFLSVKLWPILWAFLSAILSHRNSFDSENPNGFEPTLGSAGVLPAIASMYLVVPAISFLIINLAHHAGGALLGALIGGADGASLSAAQGMAGAVMRGASAPFNSIKRTIDQTDGRGGGGHG